MIYDDEKVMKIQNKHIYPYRLGGVNLHRQRCYAARKKCFIFYPNHLMVKQQYHTYRYKIDGWMHVPILIE